MLAPLTSAAAAALSHASEEAARRGDRRVGTDHLLLGLLHDQEAAADLGTDLEHAHAAAAELDREALAALGIDLGPLPGQPARLKPGNASPTSGFRAVVARAVALAGAERLRRAEPRHLVAALRELRPPDPAATLLHTLHRDRG